MKVDALTCKQSVTLIFDYYLLPGSAEDRSRSRNPVEPEALRKLGAAFSERIDRIAQMIEILQSVHHQWAITGKKDKIVLETDSFDFHSVRKVLEEQGFLLSEYQLLVTYERKWGIL
ncbi:hypothetical protein [Sporolactobacillus vineae]|uniref:hypothetical protein n=1 Tax=Sporolactobacillus vineae TaxID=444463 RepID=UPI000288C4F0|nr:hypothetical protein [Sporolactobacillus vineae]